MEIFCSYHPTKPALWECPGCNESYCGNCVSKRKVYQYGKKIPHYFCPKCNIPVNKISIGNTLGPFWKRLHKIFIYPFHIRTIILLLSLTIANVVFSSGHGLFNLMVNVAIWGILIKYSFAVLKETANGRLTPPAITLDTISNDFQIVFKQVGIYLIIGFIAYKIISSLGILIGILFICFALLSLPAMITVLVVTDSLLAAINPIVFVKMAWRIGWAYLLMVLFLALLLFAPATLGNYIIRFFPQSAHLFLLSLAQSYYSIITYHLMGYVMLQYHEEIGWAPEYDDEYFNEEEETSEEDTNSDIINKIDMFIKDGNIDHAIAFIRSELGAEIKDLNIAERYYKLLKIRQDNLKMIDHAKKYLDLLIKEKEWDKACQVYSDCSDLDKNFIPSTSSLFKIASLLNEKGNPKGAIDAYNRFVKSAPQNPLTPKAYFLSANIFNEKLNLPQKAAKILKALIKKYPDNEIIPHVESYLKKVPTVTS